MAATAFSPTPTLSVMPNYLTTTADPATAVSLLCRTRGNSRDRYLCHRRFGVLLAAKSKQVFEVGSSFARPVARLMSSQHS